MSKYKNSIDDLVYAESKQELNDKLRLIMKYVIILESCCKLKFLKKTITGVFNLGE